MATWLYNSKGRAIAFMDAGNVFSASGQFLGRLEGNEVWQGSYKGEIIASDRFVYNTTKGAALRSIPGVPGTPGIPGVPGSKSAIALPAGYRDVSVED